MFCYYYAHALFLITTIVFVKATDVNFQRYTEIANNCCPEEASKCCASSIQHRQPLNCSLTFENLISASNCIQKSLFGVKSLRISRIEDVECCNVFTEIKPGTDCVPSCVNTLRTPSIRSVEKLKSINSCRPNNRYFTCFRQCQAFLRSRRNANEKFPYLAVCDLVDRLETGVLYIGPELNE
ncbi:Her-1 [Dictyocaulus viviparus]|uniref:Her-1 n=1 Tax=Dictyocaulus viviparus TaxID=29172 RepID=A0A0D8Y639_DICVI|nr:Her-1 [Dictyocaulus viviparus]